MNTFGYPNDVFESMTADAEDIISRYPEARSALLPMLHLVQSIDGYVSPNGIAFCAHMLDLSRANVSAVATFYSQYKRRPNGEYTVGVCTNTLCAIMGGDEIFATLAERLGVGHDETTPDGTITLERIECNAACDYAPVMMINWEFFDNQTPESASDVVDRLLAGQKVAPSRGANDVASFKQVSRVLAGFDDGRADEGVAAGAPSLVGLEIAKARGWTAPALEGSDDAAATTPEPGGTPGDQAEPDTGEEQSSADRQPTTPQDTDPTTKTS